MTSELKQLAQKIATDAHRGQTRWDGRTPYISHPASVAKAVEKRMKDHPECDKYVAVAWLHDVLEDTHVTALDLQTQGVPQDVIRSVEWITKMDGDSYLDYILSVGRDHMASIVKQEDIRHNMSCFDSKKKKGSMYQKYELALWILGQEF